ncbi:MAG: hypothetical protein D6693_07525 [Planctomycetota bacterium]|nr:MAG: hypothetical protein D6693_07525 [Planctomycetota bacterium]
MAAPSAGVGRPHRSHAGFIRSGTRRSLGGGAGDRIGSAACRPTVPEAAANTRSLSMPQAVARHILVKTEAEALDLKSRLEAGEGFADLAKAHSSCPSGADGGSLGRFSKGQMVPEFDRVVFGDLPVGQVSEPVQTQFGHHLILVEERSE